MSNIEHTMTQSDILAGAYYGEHLPIMPYFHMPASEERIERAAERLMDRADAALMAGKCSQAQYDRWTKALDAWANEWLDKARSGAWR